MLNLLVKPRDQPTHLLQVEALDRRLSPSHPLKELISNQARNLRTGYTGETSLDFTLSFLPEDQFDILHNLRIRDEHGYFQIDTLIVSSRFVLIAEVKNIYGSIMFDDMGQAIRTTEDGTEEGFSSPIEQVNLQEFRLRKWLEHYDFPSFPFEKLVIYSNPNTILKNVTNSKIIANMIIHKERLLSKIEIYSKIHKSPSLTKSQMKKLSANLSAAHTSENINVMKKYKVSLNELLRGVFCPECSSLPMLYRRGRWECRECGTVSETAYITALEDYRLLIANTIKNRDARDFLGVASVNVAKQLLLNAKLDFIGNTSARKYLLS